jgi:hypothetical protein
MEKRLCSGLGAMHTRRAHWRARLARVRGARGCAPSPPSPPSHQLVEDRRRRVPDDILDIQALHIKLHLGLGWFAWDRGRGGCVFFHVSVRQIQLGREARAHLLRFLSQPPYRGYHMQIPER